MVFRSALGVLACSLPLLFSCAGPASIAESGLRFESSVAFDVPGLGIVTGLAQEPEGGVVAVGKREVAWVSATREIERRIAYKIPEPTKERPLRMPGHVEPLDLGGETHFISRGGNWHEVGVFGPDGEVRWNYRGSTAPDWLTAADLEKDGSIDYLVGMNGPGGLVRLDSAGRQVWSVGERNVWKVEAAQLDDDGDLEIVHSNGAGELWLRDADGTPLHAIKRKTYVATGFDVLTPAGADRSSLLVVEPDGFRIVDLEGQDLKTLASPVDRTALAVHVAAKGLEERVGIPRWEFLAILSSRTAAGLAVLSIYDGSDAVVHEEVLHEECAGLAWSGSDVPELLVGCDGRVLRYTAATGRAHTDGASAFLNRGTAFGPLSFGDTKTSVLESLRLHPDAECGTEECGSWRLSVEGREFILIPEYSNEGLANLTLLSFPFPESEWDGAVKSDWLALIDRLSRSDESTLEGYPRTGALVPSEKSDDWAFAETHAEDQHGREIELGLYRRGSDVGAFGVIRASDAAARDRQAEPANQEPQ